MSNVATLDKTKEHGLAMLCLKLLTVNGEKAKELRDMYKDLSLEDKAYFRAAFEAEGWIVKP